LDLIGEVIAKVKETLEQGQALASKYGTLLDQSQPRLKRIWNKYVKLPVDASELDSLRSKVHQ
jgi:hypothetical protein